MEDSKIIIDKLDKLSEKLDSHDAKFDAIDARFDRLECDIRSIKLTIEKDVMKAINVIAEGHMNLDRKLNEIIKSNKDRLTEHEIMKLKINHLEGEIQKINARTGVTA